MDQILELKNNQIIFKRAENYIVRRYGFTNDEYSNQLRIKFLRSSWRIEAEHFVMKRKLLGLTQSKVAEDTNISIADLKKLERGKDFPNRDLIAEMLKDYLQITAI